MPLLADSWEHPDGNTWVLHVRDGVTFHNGKAVDGAAVKASFERAMKMQERAVTAAKIESIEADGQNVTIKTTEPFGAFLANISEPMYSIVDVDAGTDFATAPVATGPFKVTGFEVNSYIELERYEGYWNGASDVDTMTIRCVEDDGSRGRALQSGELDIVQRVACQAHTSDPLFQESLFRAYTLLNRLKGLVDAGDLDVDIITLQRLTSLLIQDTSIPFHGEPAEGVQIMGVLETRNIDFDHVLLLSCNEGNLPRGVSDTSFIPYAIRKAYGLTTIDHKVSIYSYYFHRLLQRAHDVTILYNNATTDGQTGEMSRFMLQLMVEGPHPVQFFTLRAGQQISIERQGDIAKTSTVMQRLTERFSTACHPDKPGTPLLTPTAINRYMRCPVLFYYSYVCGLREPDASDEDTIDNRIFGNIFHEASRRVYEQLASLSRQILASDIERLLRQKVDIERAVDEAIRQELFQLRDRQQNVTHMPELNGLQLINREVIIHYLRLLLAQDKQLAPFTIIGLECDVVAPIDIETPDGTISTTIGGRIDRLDRVTETSAYGERQDRIRVVDYKTGSNRPSPLPDVEAIFRTENLPRHNDYYLQTILYAILVSRSESYNPTWLPVSPALLFIQHSAADPVLYFGKERIDDVNACTAPFLSLLKEAVEEIFDPSIPFTPTSDLNRCRLCPFRSLCRR